MSFLKRTKRITHGNITETPSAQENIEKSFETKLAEGTPVSQVFREEFGFELW